MKAESDTLRVDDAGNRYVGPANVNFDASDSGVLCQDPNSDVMGKSFKEAVTGTLHHLLDVPAMVPMPTLVP